MATLVDPLEVQFHLMHDCIRACVYVDYLTSVRPKEAAWISIGDMLYSEAVMSWNAVFGTTSQESHWKNITRDLEIPAGSGLQLFGIDYIVAHLQTTPAAWRAFHAAMVDIRNTRFAHFNHGVVHEKFPHLSWVLRSACLYRAWLLALLCAQKRAGHDVNVSNTTEDEMLMLFKAQISEVFSNKN